MVPSRKQLVTELRTSAGLQAARRLFGEHGCECATVDDLAVVDITWGLISRRLGRRPEGSIDEDVSFGVEKITFDKGQDPNHFLRPGMSVVVTVFTR